MLTPDLSQSRFVRIQLAPQQKEKVAMALLTSRHENQRDIAPQSQEIPLSSESVKLQFGYQTEAQLLEERFWHLPANSPVNVTIEGPMSLESRFIYPPSEAVLQQAYRLFVRLDGDKMRVLDFETSAENNQSIHIKGFN